jgi:spore cortex formation protein SpoVR/YcgB (stage V sporulation)
MAGVATMFDRKQIFGHNKNEELDVIEEAAKLYLRGFEARGMPIEEDESEEFLNEKEAFQENIMNQEVVEKKVSTEDNEHKKIREPPKKEPRIKEPRSEKPAKDDLGQLIAHANAFLATI